METNRDDFIIAIRSAFLKRGYQQKFSLIVLILSSALLLFLESFQIKPLDPARYISRDFIYRASFIVSIPSKFLKSGTNNIREHFTMYSQFNKIKQENKVLKQVENKIKYLESENKELKSIIGEKSLLESSNITTKILIDKQSPYLKSVIINKGIESGFKKGLSVQDGIYMIGRIIEVNYLSSRVLLLNDLNSKIPVVIEPNSIQAILTGSGKNYGNLEYLPKNKRVKNKDIVYTSGAGGVFKAGIPIGKIAYNDEKIIVDFFIDFTQLKYGNVNLINENLKK